MEDQRQNCPPRDTHHESLLEHLYACLDAREGFEHFLPGLKRHFRSCSVALMAISCETRQVEWSWISGITPRFESWCRENDGTIVDILTRRLGLAGFACEHFVCAGLMFDRHELVDAVTEDLRPWLLNEAIIDTAGLLIPIEENGHVLLLALQRDQAAGKFSAADLQELNLLVPHLRRVANLLFRFYYKPALESPVPQPSAADIRGRFCLTEAEALVCELLVKKLTPKEIARERDVSVHTVREQIRKIYQKTGCKRQVDVVTTVIAAFSAVQGLHLR